MNALRTKRSRLAIGVTTLAGALVLMTGALCRADNAVTPERLPGTTLPRFGDVVTSVTPICCGEGEITYAATVHQVFRSVNGGPWVEVTPHENVIAAQRAGHEGNSNRPTVMPPISTIIRAVAPLCCDGTEIVYITTMHKVYRSADGGVNWTEVTPTAPGTNE
jgi:hypothetical protein